jgi:hypothetical protein
MGALCSWIDLRCVALQKLSPMKTIPGLRLSAFLLLSFSADATLFAANAPVPGRLPPAPLVHDTSPITLFNGRNFEGLFIYIDGTATTPDAAWKIEDGLLRCTGLGKGYVRTTAAYADYTLRLEWRWPVRTGNSGIMLNIVGRDLLWPKCIEAQLAVNRAGEFAMFSDARGKEEIVSRNPTGVSTGRLPRPPGPSSEKPQGEWNVYEIVVAGDTITTAVNGQRVNRMTGILPSGGCIGFQSEGTPIDFRHITLTPLPAAKDINAPMPSQLVR